MRGTSAASLDAVLQATEANAADAARVGEELFAVVAVLDANPALRRVLTDPSVEADAKERLAAKVFGESVGDGTRAVVAVAVAGRWSAARDLADAIEIAGVTANVIAADAVGETERLQDELFSVAQMIAADSELRNVVTDRNYPAQAKAQLIARLLEGKATAASVALAAQAVAARSANYEKTLAKFADIAAQRRSRLVAEVRVAAPLNETEGQRLAQALATKYGRDVHVNVIVDPSVVGGIRVSIGDDTIDGTISSRLDDARRRIAS